MVVTASWLGSPMWLSSLGSSTRTHWLRHQSGHLGFPALASHPLEGWRSFCTHGCPGCLPRGQRRKETLLFHGRSCRTLWLCVSICHKYAEKTQSGRNQGRLQRRARAWAHSKDEEEFAEESRSAQPYGGIEVLGSTSDLRGERHGRKRTVPTCIRLLRTWLVIYWLYPIKDKIMKTSMTDVAVRQENIFDRGNQAKTLFLLYLKYHFTDAA